MIVIKVVSELGTSRDIQVAPNDFVAHVKSLCHALFPKTSGKLIVLRHDERELEDEKCVGDYGIHGKTNNTIEMEVPARQPYSTMDYARLVASLVKEGKAKKTSDFFHPDDWEGKWEKGDEYLSYPPVDVNNIWSSIEPSNSRELIDPKSPKSRASRGPRNSNRNAKTQKKEQSRATKEPATKRAFQAPKAPSTRSFHSLYCCNVNGFNFSVVHKLEGKWSGMAYFLGDKLQATEQHACSSKLVYNNEDECWEEQQLFTSRDGLSTGRSFRYTPHAHGSLYVENDDAELMEETLIKLQEIGNTILVLTATNVSTGQVIVTETTTCSADFQSRVRVVQRFDSFGVLCGVFICKERKILDVETGALTPLNL